MALLMNDLKISVVIPVYNVERYLQRCVDSVLVQNYSGLQIILVDDGSTDTSGQICDEYQKKNKNIIVIHQENQGLSVARNNGVARATGDYVLFVDSDDWLATGFLHKIAQAVVKEKNVDVLIYAAEKVDALDGGREYIGVHLDASRLNGKSGQEALNYILSTDKNYEWYAWKYLLRLEYLKGNELTFVAGRYYEDVEWTPRIFYAAKKVWYVDVVGIQYWFHNPGSILNVPSLKKSIDKIEIAAIACHLAQQVCSVKATADLICETFAKLYLSGFGDYINGDDKLLPYLKKNKSVLLYSHTPLAKAIRRLSKVLGFRTASKILKLCIRLRRGR